MLLVKFVLQIRVTCWQEILIWVWITFLQGTEDDVVNWLHGNGLWKMAREPYEPLWIKGGGHCNLEIYPDYIRHLCRFIQEMENITTATRLKKIRESLGLHKRSNTSTAISTKWCCRIKLRRPKCPACWKPSCPKCCCRPKCPKCCWRPKCLKCCWRPKCPKCCWRPRCPKCCWRPKCTKCFWRPKCPECSRPSCIKCFSWRCFVGACCGSEEKQNGWWWGICIDCWTLANTPQICAVVDEQGGRSSLSELKEQQFLSGVSPGVS